MRDLLKVALSAGIILGFAGVNLFAARKTTGASWRAPAQKHDHLDCQFVVHYL
jgi:hypothetical protein